MELVYINGHEGYYIDAYNQNAQTVTWDSGDYIFTIFVTYDDGYNFNKERLIEMAKSVQNVEN